MARFSRVLVFAALVSVSKADDDIKDFIFNDPDEMMIAQESRQHQTIAEPLIRIIKPTGITNSHRPQYNLDSFEEIIQESLEELNNSPRRSLTKNYQSSNRIRSKESMIKDAVLRAFERRDHVGKFAQILPIIRAMSGSQRVALASLVASQVTTPPGRAPLNLIQVRSMFGNSDNTTELMLPILLDTANLIRRAIRPGKAPREVIQPYESETQQLLRRSDTEDYELDDEPFDMGVEYSNIDNNRHVQKKYTDNRYIQHTTRKESSDNTDNKDDLNATSAMPSTITEPTVSLVKSEQANVSRVDNATLDLAADATNQTLTQDLPVAEKLRIVSRYIDRKNTHFRRGNYQPKAPSPIARRTTPEPAPPSKPITRRRPTLPGQLPTKRKVPSTTADPNKCELFTNTLCLNTEDYPTEAIVLSIRRNKAAAAALLADYTDPAEGVIDGVTAAQEAKYNEQHYLVSNRRGDTANRDFAGAGEAGFMCPSTVKYARPQRARATSGQWKYIVNTGEHTQTLRLEKCLKPKESCTYLTDNFKSKCVQVYNYHRLLTWDQQNGLHMDIFKVPTCCSCHIEGYSIAFPPLGHRIQETSSEHFPGEELSSEQGNHAYENIQSTVLKPAIKAPPFSHKKPVDTFTPFSDSQNLIPNSPFSKQNDNDDPVPPNPIDSYGNTYFPDSFNQASSVRHIKRQPTARNPPPSNFDDVTLPSFLEPPTPSATATFNFNKDSLSKFKFPGNQFKRAQTRPNLPNRIRPIRKTISGGPDDLISSGSQTVESYPDSSADGTEEINDFEEPEIGQATVVSKNPKSRITIAPKLQATTEKAENTKAQRTKETIGNENFTSHGKRINYNYHPIIDFFDGDREIETDDTIDREDSESSYSSVPESEWKPINHPTSRTGHKNTGRKKQT